MSTYVYLLGLYFPLLRFQHPFMMNMCLTRSVTKALLDRLNSTSSHYVDPTETDEEGVRILSARGSLWRGGVGMLSCGGVVAMNIVGRMAGMLLPRSLL